MDDIVIVAARRTAVGAFLGGLSTVSAANLGANVFQALMTETGVAANDVDEVVMGQVLTANCGQNTARQAAINAGISFNKTAYTINQVCGSGLRAVALGMQSIAFGDAQIVLAGGQENMSLAPHAAALRTGQKMGDLQLKDTMVADGLWDVFNDYHMGTTAENVARQYEISRTQQDEFAFASHRKAAQAQKDGKFQQEIVPIVVRTRRAKVAIDVDEHLRPETTIESLAKLRPAFVKDGTVTAGNASGINDGAAAVLLMRASEAKKRGLTPMVRIVAFATSGVDPSIMGIGPVSASQKALSKAGWGIDDLDLVEANEAFAAQACAVNVQMGWDTNIVNVNGGAVALGHPIGASGCRVLVTLLHEMQRRQAQKGLATLCIGGGMGVAVCVEAM